MLLVCFCASGQGQCTANSRVSWRECERGLVGLLLVLLWQGSGAEQCARQRVSAVGHGLLVADVSKTRQGEWVVCC